MTMKSFHLHSHHDVMQPTIFSLTSVLMVPAAVKRSPTTNDSSALKKSMWTSIPIMLLWLIFTMQPLRGIRFPFVMILAALLHSHWIAIVGVLFPRQIAQLFEFTNLP
ncbi:hypothetical protein OSTOST_24038 [Ostertagia ostertagi]